MPGRTTDQQCVARRQTEVEVADEVLAVGCANSDTVDLERALLGRSRCHLGEPAGNRVLVDQSVQPDDRRPIARERVVRIPEERQRVMDRVKCGRRLEDIAKRYLTREQPWRLNDERERIDRLTHGQVPAGEQHHPVAPIAVVVHDCGQTAVEHFAFGVLAAVQAHGGARVSQSDECVSEAGIEKFVHEAQPDQRPADDERDDGGREHVEDDDPEQGSGEGEATECQRPGEPPEDRSEGKHGHHGLNGTEQQ